MRQDFAPRLVFRPIDGQVGLHGSGWLLVAIEDGHISIIDGLARYRRAWFLAATGHIYIELRLVVEQDCEVKIRASKMRLI